MVLCIAGNVDEEKVIGICDKFLLPAEDKRLEVAFPYEPADIVKRKVSAEYTVGTPLFSVGFNCPVFKGTEMVKMEVCAGILLQMLFGSMSRWYKELFEEGLINSSFSFEVFNAEEGFFSCICSGESHAPDEVFKRCLAEIERAKAEGLDRRLFEIIRKSRYGSMIRGFNNVENCAEMMFENHLQGTGAFTAADMLAKLDFEDILAAFDTLFDASKAALSVIENHT